VQSTFRGWLAAEEPALERAEQLLARERRDVLRPAVVLRDAKVVFEHLVRLLERVCELVALEDVVVGAGLVRGAVLRVDRAANGPERSFAPFDPDDDALVGALVVESTDLPLCEPPGSRPPPHRGLRYGLVASISQFFRNPLAFLFERTSQEDRLAAYIIREHDRGRSLEDILNDRYILNRTSPQQLRRLLENPDLVRALGNDTIESVRTTMTSS
jgi:hypothetical protein